MARYTGSVCRLCRREGCKLFLKGDKCYGEHCALDRRKTVPGEHGQARQRKQSEYGLQLREKQKAKRTYGVLESQFHKYFEEADRMKGVTGENLLSLLERRLDNVIYRLGFASSRSMARQIILHGHVQVNGKKVDIPSYLVNVGEVVSIKAGSADNKFKVTVKSADGESKTTTFYFQSLREGTGKVIPKWLTIDAQELKATVDALPKREDIDISIQENLIVELYSK